MFIAILLIALAATMCSAAWWRSMSDDRNAGPLAAEKPAAQDDEEWEFCLEREIGRGAARAVSGDDRTVSEERQARRERDLDQDQENDLLRRQNDHLALLFAQQALARSQQALTEAEDLTVTKTRERAHGRSREQDDLELDR
jgi:hypothetical protein